jgi:hypothetical protein
VKYYLLAFLLGCLDAEAGQTRLLIDSHLRTFTAAEVITQYSLGADAVEVDFDISQIGNSELAYTLDALRTWPNKILILHLKDSAVDQEPQIREFLEMHSDIHKQLMFYSTESELNSLLRRYFPEIDVTRSTKTQVMNCLSSGLKDENSFIVNCIGSDLWIYYSFLEEPSSRSKIIQLIDKIRNYEAATPGPKSRITIDRISTPTAACDVIKNLSSKLDGVITENFESIRQYLLSPAFCR